MKFLNHFILLLIAFSSYSLAQRCRRRVGNPSCTQPRDVGRIGLSCVSSNRWYYDQRSRQCRWMRYRGCGGNSNRFCTPGECHSRCRR